MPSQIAESKSTSFDLPKEKANILRIDCIEATTAAGSGHPTSCASAAEIASVLFFQVMRYDPSKPGSRANDVFVLSKGHAAPLLYACWAEAGAFPRNKLLTLRKVDSDFEGHPTPRLPFVDVATGSLGQGLSAAVGMALHLKKIENGGQRVYVLAGDGESAEGSMWEAAQWASLHQLDNLCLTIDINRLGQSQPTMLEHHLETYKMRWDAFGWKAITVDGHNVEELIDAYEAAKQTIGRPCVVLARTLKGKGFPGIEDKEGWHGKALDKETAQKVIAHLKGEIHGASSGWEPKPTAPEGTRPGPLKGRMAKSSYELNGKSVSTRKGFADGLAALAKVDPRIVAIDGDVENSTYTEEFQKLAPERFFEGYIAEQNMVGMSMGLAARGSVPFVATFASFLTRAFDFIRMAAISKLNIKFVGTHVGISIGEDGPSQMGLEDLAMMCAEPDFTVLYPSDATSAWKATGLIAEHSGPCYLRTGRPDSPILYDSDEQFEIGKCKVLRKNHRDKALIVAGGVTIFEALKAYDELAKQGILIRVIDLFSVKPIDREELKTSARESGSHVVVVEDHYEHGGIGDAVLSALEQEPVRVTKLTVREIPRSGKAAELIRKYGISASDIVKAVKSAKQNSKP